MFRDILSLKATLVEHATFCDGITRKYDINGNLSKVNEIHQNIDNANKSEKEQQFIDEIYFNTILYQLELQQELLVKKNNFVSIEVIDCIMLWWKK